tara:strand:+ start:839 stop:2290 length:1452 start_codon:yes stop_codon:yes gene_type:complete
MAVEYPTLISVLTTDTFEQWRQKTNSMISHTEAGKENIGDLSLLSTEDKFSIVNAINEVHNEVDSTGISIGDLTLLNSDISAVDLVSAINKNYEYQKNNTGTQISTEKTNREDADTAIQSELDTTQLSMGINADGTFTTFSDATYVNTSTNIRSAVGTLDTSLKSTSDLLDALVSSVGAGSNGSLTIPTSVNYIDPTENIKDNIVILDNELKSVANSVSNFPSLAADNETKINNIITSIGSDATGTMVEYDPALLTATASDLSTNIKLLDNKIELLDAKDTSIDAAIAALASTVGGTDGSIAAALIPLNTKLTNIIATLGTISQVGAMAEADITVGGVKNTFANLTNIKSNINLLDAELDAINARANSLSISSVSGLQAELNLKSPISVIGDIADLSDGFPRKNTIVTIVDALNALNDSVSAIVAEYNGGIGGWVLKTGDTMTGGLKIVDANLMVGDVSGFNIADGASGKIVATGDIEALRRS